MILRIVKAKPKEKTKEDNKMIPKSPLSKTPANKNSEIKELVLILKRENFQKIINMIILIHSSNMKILSYIFMIFYHIGENIETKNLEFLFGFNRLRDLFTTFKSNGFDYIHELIIRLMRNLVLRRINEINTLGDKRKTRSSKIIKKKTLESANDLNNSISYGENLTLTLVNNETKSSKNNIISSKEKIIEKISEISKDINKEEDSGFSSEELAEINLIIYNSLLYIKIRISLFYELLKYPKQIINLINNINILLEVLDCLVAKKPKNILISMNFRIFEIFINDVFLLNESKFISEMERYIPRKDPELINHKSLVIKMLFGFNKLQKSLKEINIKYVV